MRFVCLSRTRQLLQQGAGTVSEIAYQVGFSNLSYFARVFREAFGKLRSEVGAEIKKLNSLLDINSAA